MCYEKLIHFRHFVHKREVKLKCVFSLYSYFYLKVLSLELEYVNLLKKTLLNIGNNLIGNIIEQKY